MRTNILLAIVISFLSSLALSAQQESAVDIFAWPLSASKSQTLARISYTSTNATVKSYTPPKIPPGEEIVRIGFHHSSGEWSGVATSASNFAPSRDRKVQLLVNTEGHLYHLGFKASDLPRSSRSGKGKDGLGVEVVRMQKGPTPHLNKPVVLNAEGQVEGKEPEKTFLQKYWWVIGGFLLLQLVLGGAGKE